MNNGIKNLLQMEPRRNGALPGNPPAGKPAAAGRETEARAAPQEKVTLTEAARKIADLSNKAGGVPMDEARVRQIRESIENGSYQPDPVAIAKALMRFEQGG